MSYDYEDDYAEFRSGSPRGSGGGGKPKGPPPDYIQVKERIALFYKAFPEGRIQTTKVWVSSEPDGRPRVWVRAKAYRTTEDTHPGVGTSFMVLGGNNPFTAGSEVENTETSAWGRAIVATGVSADRGIASIDEIEGKRSVNEPKSAPSKLREDTEKGQAAKPATKPRRATTKAKTPTSTAKPAPAKESTTEGDGKDAEPEPERKDEAGAKELTNEQFKEMVIKHSVQIDHLQTMARELVAEGIIRDVGGFKNLNDDERFTLLMSVLAARD